MTADPADGKAAAAARSHRSHGSHCRPVFQPRQPPAGLDGRGPDDPHLGRGLRHRALTLRGHPGHHLWRGVQPRWPAARLRGRRATSRSGTRTTAEAAPPSPARLQRDARAWHEQEARASLLAEPTQWFTSRISHDPPAGHAARRIGGCGAIERKLRRNSVSGGRRTTMPRAASRLEPPTRTCGAATQ